MFCIPTLCTPRGFKCVRTNNPSPASRRPFVCPHTHTPIIRSASLAAHGKTRVLNLRRELFVYVYRYVRFGCVDAHIHCNKSYTIMYMCHSCYRPRKPARNALAENAAVCNELWNADARPSCHCKHGVNCYVRDINTAMSEWTKWGVDACRSCVMSTPVSVREQLEGRLVSCHEQSLTGRNNFHCAKYWIVYSNWKDSWWWSHERRIFLLTYKIKCV